MTEVTFIDPGTKQSAIVQWDGNTVLMHEIIENNEMRTMLLNHVAEFDVLAIEQIRHQGVAIGSEVLDTCEWVGRFCELSVLVAKRKPLLVPRMKVKMHLCGRSTNDAGVRSALIERFGEPGKKASPGVLYGVHRDEWQALAGAVYVYDTVLAPLESILG